MILKCSQKFPTCSGFLAKIKLGRISPMFQEGVSIYRCLLNAQVHQLLCNNCEDFEVWSFRNNNFTFNAYTTVKCVLIDKTSNWLERFHPNKEGKYFQSLFLLICKSPKVCRVRQSVQMICGFLMDVRIAITIFAF